MSSFQKASRKQAKLKALLDGTSGSGKTQTMLRMIQGVLALCGGKAAVIDSENHSVEKKPNDLLKNVDVANIENRTLDNYIKLIKEAADAGYTAIGIDSITHPWHELLEEIERLAKTKYGGNTFRAWAEGTPKQRSLIDAILFSPCHIIATGRVKSDWVVETNANGKAQPRKVGMQTEQGKGLEYEFDVWMRMGEENIGLVLKDRFDIGIQGKSYDKPGEDFAKLLINGLLQGEDDEVKVAAAFLELKFTPEQQKIARTKYPVTADLLKHIAEYKQTKAE